MRRGRKDRVLRPAGRTGEAAERGAMTRRRI